MKNRKHPYNEKQRMNQWAAKLLGWIIVGSLLMYGISQLAQYIIVITQMPQP